MFPSNRLAFAVALASSAALASAATVTNTWTGTSPGDFNVASNWSQGRVPGTDAVDVDHIAIGGGSVVTLAADLSANAAHVDRVAVNDGATLQLNVGGYLKTDQAAWDHGRLHLGTSGSGHVVVNGGTLYVKNIFLANSSTITVNSGLLFGYDSRSMEIGTTNGATATVSVTGGDFLTNNGLKLGMGGGTGVIEQSGGRLAVNNTTVIGDTNSKAIVNLSGGETWFAIPTFAGAAGSTAEVNITGGTLYLGREVTIGDAGNASIIVSGGTLTGSTESPLEGRFGYGRGIDSLSIGTGTGTGLLKIVGNKGTVYIYKNSTTANVTVGTNGTLAFDIDDATVSALMVQGGTTTLGGIIDLDLINGYTPAPGAVYDLITGPNTIVDNGFSLAPGDEAFWSLSIIGTAGSGQTLQATYVPEPAGLALLAAAAPIFVRRRRMWR